MSSRPYFLDGEIRHRLGGIALATSPANTAAFAALVLDLPGELVGALSRCD